MSVEQFKENLWRILLYVSIACVSLFVLAGAESAAVVIKDASVGLGSFDDLLPPAIELALATLGLPFGILVVALCWKACQKSLDFAWPHLVIDAALGMGMAAVTYLGFAKYEAFRAYPPLLAACVVLGVGMSALLALLSGKSELQSWVSPRHLLTWASAVALIAAAGLHWVNYVLYPGLYYPFHLGVMTATYALLTLGIAGLLIRARWNEGAPDPLIAVAMAIASLAGLASGYASTDLRPHVRTYSIVGQTAVLFADRVTTRSLESHALDELPEKLPSRDSYVEVFEQHHPFPELPDGFQLDDYNVLLVTTEAVRFDSTSLGAPSLESTPHLASLAADAYVNTRAYSPSSGTLHSMAANLAMEYPSMLPLETWSKPWHGKLDDSVATVAELFQDKGRHTFWIGHNHNRAFSGKINGFDQGFEDVDLYVDASSDPSRDLDARIAGAAVDKFSGLADTDERFFGWVFFSSPHSPYIAHYPDRPDQSPRERYIQEVRYADEQLAVVLEGLRDHGHWEDTIVVFMSDHGEEFREHGGIHHKSTLYNEVTHVPFVVRIPGVSATTSETPMSTLYVWPWLLMQGDGELAAHATEKIDRSLGPIMDATEGGVLVELLGHDRMKSALIYPDMTIHYDFISRLYELYDLQEDPGEQNNIFRSAREARRYEQRMLRYRAFRLENERQRVIE
jgi:arylsulfatase A-like enzyme